MNNTNTQFHQSRIIYLVGAGIGLIAAFLPWVTVSIFGVNQSQSGFDGGDGKITFVLFAIAGVLTFLGDRTKPMSRPMQIGIGILGLLSALVPIYDMITASSKINELTQRINLDIKALRNIFSFSIGIYLTLLAGLALVAYAGYSYVLANRAAGKADFDMSDFNKIVSDSTKTIVNAGTAATKAVKETLAEQQAEKQKEVAPQEAPAQNVAPTPEVVETTPPVQPVEPAPQAEQAPADQQPE